jgi:thymidylate synthase
MLNPIFVDATTLPDAWFQAVYQCIHHGREFIIDRGSYAGDKRLEFDYFTAHIKQPWAGSDADINLLLPHLAEGCNIPNPVDDGYLDNYVANYLMGNELAKEESYTYGQRMTKYQIPSEWVHKWDFDNSSSGWDNSPDKKPWNKILIQDKELWENPKIIIEDIEKREYYLNQIELLIQTYKTKGYRNNQMVLQVAHPSDMLLQDPPCLRLIDTRIQEEADGKTYLHFFPEFRSWDLWGGFPANLGGIELMKQLIAAEIGVENGSMIVRSKGLHLYKYVWELAEAIAHKSIDEARACILPPHEHKE